ncbi:hypothetical protein [Rubinisphaera margarita]|uniref:hypothetical protein n=1 Tax=Rubinisphaera margarita TaxID=2909586 RepID=UPI001EE89D5B|nr:hypothetical protein [Rubinisphaera margarita]MCG6158492.1 hypothetical protein [Rubinisphaera margarita]
MNHVNAVPTNPLPKYQTLPPGNRTLIELGEAGKKRAIPSKKPTAKNDDGLVSKDSRGDTI